MKTLVLFAALALVGIPRAHGQKTTTLPNGNIVSTLANGEVWATIHPDGIPIAIRLTSDMPTAGQFRTGIVRNLPPTDIVGSPESVEIQILGDCQTKTYQVWGTLPYDGKMRDGAPEMELATGPENVTRRVESDSLMSHVFHVVCKP